MFYCSAVVVRRLDPGRVGRVSPMTSLNTDTHLRVASCRWRYAINSFRFIGWRSQSRDRSGRTKSFLSLALLSSVVAPDWRGR